MKTDYRDSAAAKFSDFHQRLRQSIAQAKAPICVGLDPVPKRLPGHLGEGTKACRQFLLELIEATREHVAAFKPNAAFYEAYGQDGWRILAELRDAIGPDALLIYDAKRGDVEHTNEAYAHAAFDELRADAITVQPYLGGAALAPFLSRPDRGIFALCVTSNSGAESIQNLDVDGKPLYLEIARQAKSWSKFANVGLVVGTTKPEALRNVLQISPELPLLMPGSGAQGGSLKVLEDLKSAGATGLLSFSRSVIYASDGKDFAQAALQEVLRLKQELSTI